MDGVWIGVVNELLQAGTWSEMNGSGGVDEIEGALNEDNDGRRMKTVTVGE